MFIANQLLKSKPSLSPSEGERDGVRGFFRTLVQSLCRVPFEDHKIRNRWRMITLPTLAGMLW